MFLKQTYGLKVNIFKKTNINDMENENFNLINNMIDGSYNILKMHGESFNENQINTLKAKIELLVQKLNDKQVKNKQEEVMQEVIEQRKVQENKREKVYEVLKNNRTETVSESDMTTVMSSGFLSVFRSLEIGQEMYDVSTNTNYRRIK